MNSKLQLILLVLIDGSCAIDRINCSLVTPVNRQTQSGGYEFHLFRCRDEIVKLLEMFLLGGF